MSVTIKDVAKEAKVATSVLYNRNRTYWKGINNL